MTDPAIESVNPMTGEVVARYPLTTSAEVDRALTRSVTAFPAWSETAFSERGRLFRALAGRLTSRREELARVMATEMGKPIRQGRDEVDKCAITCHFYAEHSERFLADEPLVTEGGSCYIHFQPLGLILAIMPWNFPLWQVVRFAAPTLMAGNVGILKHAPNVPRCAIALAELFQDAGFPPGVFQNLFLGNAETERLIADARIRGVSLTGSETAGRRVGTAAGDSLKRVVLELGGSDPFVVLEDANVRAAARAATDARTINNGESCIAAKRFIVCPPSLSSFLVAFHEEMARLRTGDPLDEATDIGPLARPDLLETLDTQVTHTLRAGAKLELGGKRLPGVGNLYAPTILSGVRPGMACFEEETFGPVAAVCAARSEEDAVRLANLSRFGLGASVWTADARRGERVALHLDAGMTFVNEKVHSAPGVPFGGIKRSGYGRELGVLGIREFVNAKTVWVSKS